MRVVTERKIEIKSFEIVPEYKMVGEQAMASELPVKRSNFINQDSNQLPMVMEEMSSIVSNIVNEKAESDKAQHVAHMFWATKQWC